MRSGQRPSSKAATIPAIVTWLPFLAAGWAPGATPSASSGAGGRLPRARIRQLPESMQGLPGPEPEGAVAAGPLTGRVGNPGRQPTRRPVGPPPLLPLCACASSQSHAGGNTSAPVERLRPFPRRHPIALVTNFIPGELSDRCCQRLRGFPGADDAGLVVEAWIRSTRARGRPRPGSPSRWPRSRSAPTLPGGTCGATDAPPGAGRPSPPRAGAQ